MGIVEEEQAIGKPSSLLGTWRLGHGNHADQSYSGVKAGMFGGVALFAVIFLASGIPRIQDDILKVRYG